MDSIQNFLTQNEWWAWVTFIVAVAGFVGWWWFNFGHNLRYKVAAMLFALAAAVWMAALYFTAGFDDGHGGAAVASGVVFMVMIAWHAH